MNPVLLKPQSEIGAQVVVRGRVVGNARARDYHAMKPELLATVRESFARLAASADIVLVEGAGSPAEINLRQGDIANMGFATAERVPVALVGDVERGGVIASLLGTMALLMPEERALVRGFIVNKFRGDASLFDEARSEIATRTGLADLGLVPWFAAARRLPAEDAVSLDSVSRFGGAVRAPLRIIVLRLPRIANFDDLDPLAAESDVALTMLEPGAAIPGDADAVILPGSKATRADLDALRRAGWDVDLAAHVHRGGRVLGLCGGYQMLGTTIADPAGIEGEPGESAGLALLDVATILAPEKTLREVAGVECRSGAAVRGYEIHVGVSRSAATRAMLTLGGRDDGAVSADGRIEGCYLHGLFDSAPFRRAWLDRLRAARGIAAGPAGVDWDQTVDRTLDERARHLERALDIERIIAIARGRA
jgi:adenosylcobyric acid synthase